DDIESAYTATMRARRKQSRGSGGLVHARAELFFI
ncbi:hypothetical protein THAOC_29831, partial [Thalassiosira oceanica]